MNEIKIETKNGKVVAMVTKRFQKKAIIFGTDEYKLWREVLKDFPAVEMATKSIKKNPDKKTTKYLTYANMERYIKSQESNEKLLKEFYAIKEGTAFTKNAYPAVKSWFVERFPNYDKICIPDSNNESSVKLKKAI